jgi:hypothetical protein
VNACCAGSALGSWLIILGTGGRVFIFASLTGSRGAISSAISGVETGTAELIPTAPARFGLCMSGSLGTRGQPRM